MVAVICNVPWLPVLPWSSASCSLRMECHALLDQKQELRAGASTKQIIQLIIRCVYINFLFSIVLVSFYCTSCLLHFLPPRDRLPAGISSSSNNMRRHKVAYRQANVQCPTRTCLQLADSYFLNIDNVVLRWTPTTLQHNRTDNVFCTLANL